MVALLYSRGQRGDGDPAEEEAGASEEQPLVEEGRGALAGQRR